jgi:sulfatase maturation enzyme AslB (radical SAM superfamily)
VLTHDCNLRCRYCHEIKDPARMPAAIAMRALDVYAAARPAEPRIKLFGGEPTLNADVLTAVLGRARAAIPGVRFELTTNGTLVDESLLDAILARGDVELHVSLDGAPAHHDENRRVHLPLAASSGGSVHAAATRLAPRLSAARAIVNLTIAPWTAASVDDDLAHLLSLGFRRFNLLPAYYLAWTDDELASLRRSFEAIERRVLASWRGADPIELTNVDVQAMYTFFNDGLVVDCDGDVFQTNLFLWRPFDSLRPRLRRGHIADDPATWRPHPPAADVDRWIRETATATTLGATAAVDRELTRLCERLISRRGRPARRPSRRAAEM